MAATQEDDDFTTTTTSSTISLSGDDAKTTSFILPSDLLDENGLDEEWQLLRHLQAAEALPEKVCKFFLELNATSAPPIGYDVYNGVVFLVRTKNIGVQVTTLELDLKGHENSKVRVFTKVGEYNKTALTADNIFSDPGSWVEVTKSPAVAVRSAERRTAIIPAEQFQPFMMEPKESRLIYVALLADVPLMKAATSETTVLDDVYAKNNELATHVGYAVNGENLESSPFVGVQTIANRPFHGIIHYETKLPCEDQREAFSMELPYFCDQQEPAAIVISFTTLAVNEAVGRAMSRDAKLIRMQNFGGLRFQITSTKTDVVPFDGPCPFKFEKCSKLVVTIHFGHDETLNPGIVQYEIMKYATDYNVTAFELGYVGKMPLSLDYFITLVGAPKHYELDEFQELYYGEETARFLADMTGEEILAAGLAPGKRNVPRSTGDSDGTDNNSEEEGVVPTTRRQRRRNLQSTSAKIHTSIYGAYPAWPEPQHPHSVRGVDSMATVEILQSAFDENGTVYVQYLKDGLLRPGPIHEETRIAFFEGITATDAELDESSLWMPTSAPTQAPTLDPDAEPEVLGMPTSTVRILAILALVVGSICCLCTIYWEIQHRLEEKEKLKRNARAAQRKVDKLRAEQYRRIAEKKRQIKDRSSSEDVSEHSSSLMEPMLT